MLDRGHVKYKFRSQISDHKSQTLNNGTASRIRKENTSQREDRNGGQQQDG